MASSGACSWRDFWVPMLCAKRTDTATRARTRPRDVNQDTRTELWRLLLEGQYDALKAHGDSARGLGLLGGLALCYTYHGESRACEHSS
jgi:hypothetical protein